VELSSEEIASIPALGLADDGLAALRKDAADDVSV
jgi:hypothetical protein